MGQDHSSRVLRVQTVLFQNEQAQLWRLLRGLGAAARHLTESGLVARVEWSLGDCSPSPIFTANDAQAMLEAVVGTIDRVQYLFFDENLGSSGGHNRLADGAISDLLLVLNPDTYPSPTALVELTKAIDKPQVGIVEARQIPLEHPREYDLVTGETSWASGFCMLVRRTIFEELGGFDHEHFLLHCDDVDLSWRARMAGYKVLTAPYAAVFHDKRPRTDNTWPAPDVEIYHAALGRLMLATRWGREDVVKETIHSIECGRSEPQRLALAEFRARSADGRLPTPIVNADRVSQFIDGEYAKHRF